MEPVGEEGGRGPGLIAGLVVGLALGGGLAWLSRTTGGLFVAVPLLFVGGALARARPFLAGFLLGVSAGAMTWPAYLLVSWLSR